MSATAATYIAHLYSSLSRTPVKPSLASSKLSLEQSINYGQRSVGRSVGDTVAHSVCLLFAYHSTTALIIIKRIEDRRERGHRQKGRLGDMVTLSIDGRQSTVKEEKKKR